MKILAINGALREGNTDFMLKTFTEGLKCELINLRDINIEYRSNLDLDYIEDGDDMLALSQRLEAADLVILASPCYFWNMSGLMKNFVDRCNPYWHNKKLKGKKFYLLSVGGHEDSVPEAIKALNYYVKGVFGTTVGFYYAVGDKVGEVNNQKVIKELRAQREVLHGQGLL